MTRPKLTCPGGSAAPSPVWFAMASSERRLAVGDGTIVYSRTSSTGLKTSYPGAVINGITSAFFVTSSVWR